jgi:hypothetical protein
VVSRGDNTIVTRQPLRASITTLAGQIGVNVYDSYIAGWPGGDGSVLVLVVDAKAAQPLCDALAGSDSI